MAEEVAPHSYEVTTADGTYRRNRKDLIRMPNPSDGDRDDEQTNSPGQSRVTRVNHECRLTRNTSTQKQQGTPTTKSFGPQLDTNLNFVNSVKTLYQKGEM